MTQSKKMTDEEFVLAILKDGKQHSGEEIAAKSLIQRGHGLTLHSRVASLRNHGWIIASKKIKGSRDFVYWLTGKEEGRELPKKKPPVVQAYIYRTDADMPENERICQIIDRHEPDHTLEPSFVIEFMNGKRMVAWGAELRPWYAN